MRKAKALTALLIRSALGVKFWDGAGISFKHFFQGNNAGEFIGFFWNHGFRLTGLYEIHGDFADAQGLKWYVGPGAILVFMITMIITITISMARISVLMEF
jgi:hypothetical protein